MFCSDFSQICMFCNDDRSKLVPESTHSGVSWVVHCRQPNEKLKNEDLIIEREVFF